MSNPSHEPVIPVKLVIGMLTAFPGLLDQISPVLEAHFGPADFRSKAFPFTVTEYYHAEMGSPLQRFFISFSRLISPDEIVAIKHYTFEVEEAFRADRAGRKINLDPGYLDFHKLVLASFKSGSYKLYLSRNVYGDMTLHYAKGVFQPFEWSFPDFKQGLYTEIFLKIRQLYKKNLAESR